MNHTGLHMGMCLWMRVWAVYGACMDSLPFSWFYCPHLTTVRGFPITFGIDSDQTVNTHRLMWIVAWSFLLLSTDVVTLLCFRLIPEKECFHCNEYCTKLICFLAILKLLEKTFYQLTVCCEKIMKKPALCLCQQQRISFAAIMNGALRAPDKTPGHWSHVDKTSQSPPWQNLP